MVQKVPFERKASETNEHVFNESNVCIFCSHGKPYAEYKKIPCVTRIENQRVETGVLQFGDDWPGIFIRGDNALHLGMTLKAYLDGEIEDPISTMYLKGLANLLSSCDAQLVDNDE